MKHKISILSVLMASLSALSATERTHLAVWTKSGTIVYALQDQPKLFFTDSTLVITALCMQDVYEFKDLLHLTYETASDTIHVNKLDKVTYIGDSLTFRIEDDFLIFSGIKAGSAVSLYSPGGILLFSDTCTADGQYRLPLPELNAGVYIINVNGLTYKIAKK